MQTSEHRPTKLFNRNFLLLWQGQIVSALGSQAFYIAVTFWIKKETESASLMGLYLMATSLPAILLGPLTGVFADRHSRRRIMITCDVISSLALLSLAAVMFFGSNAKTFVLAWIFIASMTARVSGSFLGPAVAALVPDLVPRESLIKANSLRSSSFQIAKFAGKAVAGTLLRVLGAPILFLIDGLTYLFSAFSESLIEAPALERSSGKAANNNFFADLKQGFRYAWNHPGMKALYASLAALNFFIAPFFLLLPFYVEDVLLKTVDWYGFILAASGFGTLCGLTISSLMKTKGSMKARILAFMIPAASLGLALQGLFASAPVALVSMFLYGLLTGIFNIQIFTLVQLTTPAELRGRVVGLLTTICASLTPLSMGIFGVVTDLLDHNVPLIYNACAAILFISSSLAAVSPGYRTFLASSP